MYVWRSRTETQQRAVRSQWATPGRDQIRRMARDEGGCGSWPLNTHQPAVSGPIELESKSAPGAVATGLDSVCRASVTNGVMVAASWQPAVEAGCVPGGNV